MKFVLQFSSFARRKTAFKINFRILELCKSCYQKFNRFHHFTVIFLPVYFIILILMFQAKSLLQIGLSAWSYATLILATSDRHFKIGKVLNIYWCLTNSTLYKLDYLYMVHGIKKITRFHYPQISIPLQISR